MKTIGLAIVLSVAAAAVSAVGGEIYRWVDENGVQRFSDQPPSAASNPRRFGQTDAIPHDPAADRKRTETDQQHLKSWADDHIQRQAETEAEARRLREQQRAEQARMEAERQQAEALRKVEMETKRQDKSAAKKARTRPSGASPK